MGKRKLTLKQYLIDNYGYMKNPTEEEILGAIIQWYLIAGARAVNSNEMRNLGLSPAYDLLTRAMKHESPRRIVYAYLVKNEKGNTVCMVKLTHLAHYFLKHAQEN